MAVNLGSSNISTIKLGATDVSKIYLGLDVVFGGVVPFEFGNALKFDGINDFGSLGSSTELFGAGNEFVISFWFKSSTSTLSPTSNFVCTNGAENDLVLMASASSGNNGRVRITINGVAFTWNYAWSQDTNWHHYYFYRDSLANVYLVVNGVDFGSIGTNVGALNIQYFGRRGGSNTLNLNGTIDDFYIGDGVSGSLLKAQQTYNSGNGSNPQQVHSNNGSIYLNYNQDIPDTVMIDTSGNGNDVTLSNFTGTYLIPH